MKINHMTISNDLGCFFPFDGSLIKWKNIIKSIKHSKKQNSKQLREKKKTQKQNKQTNIKHLSKSFGELKSSTLPAGLLFPSLYSKKREVVDWINLNKQTCIKIYKYLIE